MNGTALRKPTARRVMGMVAGIVIIALGIALFKQSHLGNDSISALNMRLAELLGISLGTQNLCTNILFFLLEFWFGRKYIGLGTFVNGICIGYIVTAFYDPIHAHFGDAPSLAVQLAWVIAAVLVTALGASLYQTADLGIAPYDYLSLHTLPVLRVPHLHRCAQRPAVLAAGWPCGPWHLDLCVLPWALHPVLRSDVLPEGAAIQGAAIQTEQLRNPAASNHTLRGSFLLLPLSRK